MSYSASEAVLWLIVAAVLNSRTTVHGASALCCQSGRALASALPQFLQLRVLYEDKLLF